MKRKNLNHNSVLKNNIVKHIVLEAPTADELEKKIKKYESILARALTNLYKISELTLSRDGFYHITANGSYQAVINFTFSGISRQNNPYPERTLKDLEQLTILESGKKHESQKGIATPLSLTKISTIREIKLEANSLAELEEVMCNSQRCIIENIISKTNLEHISFFYLNRRKDIETGQINTIMQYKYEARDFEKNIAKHSSHDEH